MHIIMHIKKAEPRIAGRIGSNDLQKKMIARTDRRRAVAL